MTTMDYMSLDTLLPHSLDFNQHTLSILLTLSVSFCIVKFSFISQEHNNISRKSYILAYMQKDCIAKQNGVVTFSIAI